MAKKINIRKMTMTEFDEYIKEYRKETEALRRKTDLEIDVIRKEADIIRKETDQIRKETEAIRKESEEISKKNKIEIEAISRESKILEKKMHDLGVNIGSAAEVSIYHGLIKTKKLQNIFFNTISRNITYRDNDGKTLTEADIILMNGKYAAIVEVKHRVNRTAINDFIKNKLPIIRSCDKYIQGKKLLLFIGGDSIEKKSIQHAKAAGIGILLNDSNGVVESLNSNIH